MKNIREDEEGKRGNIQHESLLEKFPAHATKHFSVFSQP